MSKTKKLGGYGNFGDGDKRSYLKGLNRSGERLSEQRIPSRQTRWMFLPSHEPKRIEQHFKMGDLRYLKFMLRLHGQTKLEGSLLFSPTE